MPDEKTQSPSSEPSELPALEFDQMERVTPEQMAAAKIQARAARMEARAAARAGSPEASATPMSEVQTTQTAPRPESVSRPVERKSTAAEVAEADDEPQAPTSFTLPRPLPVALIVVGLVMIVGYIADLTEGLPPQIANLGWQTSFLERVFNMAVIPLLATLLILAGLWFGDAVSGAKSRLRNLLVGVLSILFGAALIFAIPLYYRATNTLVEGKRAEINTLRRDQNPIPGSELAERFDSALKQLDQVRSTKILRYGLNAGSVGIGMLFLGIFGIRYARKREDVGYACPSCQSVDVRLAKMNRDEKSLALVTRLHTFSCRRCGKRFRRFSLTGKPYPFFF